MTEEYHSDNEPSAHRAETVSDAFKKLALHGQQSSDQQYNGPISLRDSARSWGPIAAVAFVLFFLLATLAMQRNFESTQCVLTGNTGRAGIAGYLPAALRSIEAYTTLVAAIIVATLMAAVGRRPLFAPVLVVAAISAIATFRHIEDLAIFAITSLLFTLISRIKPGVIWVVPLVLPLLYFTFVPTFEWQARGLAWSSSLTLASPDFHRLKWGALLIAASIPLAIHLSSRSAVMLAISIAVYLWSEQWAGVLSAGVVFAALELLLARLDSANLPLPSLNAYLHAAFGMILSASFILVGFSQFQRTTLNHKSLERNRARELLTFVPLNQACSAKRGDISVVSGQPLDPGGLAFNEYQTIAKGGFPSLGLLKNKGVYSVITGANTPLFFTLLNDPEWQQVTAETFQPLENYLARSNDHEEDVLGKLGPGKLQLFERK